MKLKGKNVLVYGLGISGQSACKLLHEKGACVSIYDDEKRFSSLYSFCASPQSKKFDLVVLSPGIKIRDNSLISHFEQTKTPIISELDLGYLFCRGKIIGITGTNGKTTVTSLVGEIFKQAGKQTFVCGNIGLPFTSIASQTDKNSFVICEVSNFQLESSVKFRADEGTILNLAPDHIDRHGSYEEYVRVKRKILSGKNQKVVLNFDDEGSKLSKIDKKTLFFSKFPLEKGVFVKNNAIYFNKKKIISLADIPLFGEKNLENVLASVALSVRYKIKPQTIKNGIIQFVAPAHRLEYIGKINGAEFFDDSKATNISATIGGIKSLGERGLVLMLGGLNKGFEFDEIFNKGFQFDKVICFGSAGQEISLCAEKYGYSPLLFESMKEASFYVKNNATGGQKVLLSPACASFDEFVSYAVRGEVFREIVTGEYEKNENC